jgi:hypothetical protein
VTDHGALTGLVPDDDHTQYVLRQPDANVILNDSGGDFDWRWEGDTADQLLVLDAGLGAVQIGATVAGEIADFRATAIVFNEDSADIDFRVESNGNANALFVDGGTNRIGIGTNAPAVDFEIRDIDANGTTHMRLQNDGATVMDFIMASDVAGTSSAFLAYRSRNTVASPTAVASGDVIFNINAKAHDGSVYADSGLIRFQTTEAWTGSARGSAILFFNTPTGSTVISEAMRIQGDQTLKLSAAASWTANGAGTVTISNLAPAGVGTATISKWLTITDNAGVVMYIPAFT